MEKSLARFFRTLNSKLIGTDNLLVEKILKIPFAFSGFFYRRKRAALSSGSNITLIENFDSNIKLKIDINRTMGCAIYWTGFHEYKELLFLHKYLMPDMVFIDVGANLGEYTLFCCKRLANGRVLSFEPLPSIRKFLLENIELNGFKNAIVYDCGLSDENKRLAIYEVEDTHEGLATIYPGERVIKQKIEVELKRMDDALVNQNRVDFIKIDIEGAELMALRGGLNTIKKFRPIVMLELNQKTYEAAGYTIEDIHIFFKELNYQSYSIERRGKISKCESMPLFGNILFIPNENSIHNTMVS
ncbi:FkbM family methyltransferase [Chryseosolibacter indicus]|uniref:FkbM family methyltransferase n=1 Tax=Chryseosolibacter indicus TaxID=2782351 RepID=A0ABS5VZN9_9BACT|nr:FkbM family methyltransferase [Chryseosolibacter indicus]MBT1705496.1 FkbM family methyltransferase [Chryseosolibacter indicus]